MAAILHFIKPKNKLEEGGRSVAPTQLDAEEPEKICPNCRKHIPLSHLWADQMVCSCGYHFRMKARQRILALADRDSFVEMKTGGRNCILPPGPIHTASAFFSPDRGQNR